MVLMDVAASLVVMLLHLAVHNNTLSFCLCKLKKGGHELLQDLLLVSSEFLVIISVIFTAGKATILSPREEPSSILWLSPQRIPHKGDQRSVSFMLGSLLSSVMGFSGSFYSQKKPQNQQKTASFMIMQDYLCLMSHH